MNDFEKKLEEMRAIVNASKKPKPKTKTIYSEVMPWLELLLNCTSCRRFWAGFMVGASICFSFVYGFFYFVIVGFAWVLFWEWASYAYKVSAAGGESFQKSLQGMNLFETVDALIGSKESNAIYLCMIILFMLTLVRFDIFLCIILGIVLHILLILRNIQVLLEKF